MNELVTNGINSSRISVIQNAIQCTHGEKQIGDHRTEKRSFLSIDKNMFVIGYVGRLSEEKGVNYLIEAASILKQLAATFKIIILGDGPKKIELEYLTKSKGLDNEIIFAGFQDDIDKWLTAIDVFVLPSLTEGTPMALLEAMSMGIPVIASAVGGVPGIVKNRVNGFLIDPGDYSGLCDKITLLKNNPALREKMASEAVKTIKERFDVNAWCGKIESEYESLLQKEL
jgi:glycosyltransferase involved in cell wall biosynthesis